MESLYFRPRNGALQKVNVSEVNKRTVFKFHRKTSIESDFDSEDDVCRQEVAKNLSGKVIKLYDQCMDILSYYTHCFESLIDFPEDFGKEIFDKALNKLLVDNENTKKTVQIYCEAYPKTFLPECKLKNIMMVNNYEISLPMMLSSTVKLDLSNCQLDDDHDLLGQMVHLAMLETLCLAGNILTDKGIRRLLLPAHGGKHLTKLKYLDMSNNRLERRALVRVNMITTLATIVLGERDFELEVMENTLRPCYRMRKCPRFEKVETLGFGSRLLDKWAEASEVKVKVKRESGFYSKPQIILGSSKPNTETVSVKNKVMFDRIKALGEVSSSRKTVKSIKRKVDTVDLVGSKKVKLAKTETSATASVGNEFDQNLLSLYM